LTLTQIGTVFNDPARTASSLCGKTVESLSPAHLRATLRIERLVMNDAHDYPLGYSDHEARRLAEQGVLLEDLTQDMLRRAGLQHGMHVLDIGRGVGDVSLLAARMVGPEGQVLGIDRSASSVEAARGRARSLGVTSFDSDQRFDAIVGRMVLLFLREPVGALQRLSRKLAPGGIMAFQEIDIPQMAQSPPSELFTQVRRWIIETFVRAGLPGPEMIAVTGVGCGPKPFGHEYYAHVLRSLLPTAERYGITTAAQSGIDTLATRLLEDALANDRVTFLPRMVTAWAKFSPKGEVFAEGRNTTLRSRLNGEAAATQAGVPPRKQWLLADGARSAHHT
jgi:ubiquinone/menaquinone biosynthesis C-methylase UbiE